MTHFVYLGLGVVEKRVEVLECVVVEHNLGLIVCASDDVAYGSERGGHHFDFLMAEQRHQVWHKSGFDDHLNDMIASVCQIRNGPHRVDEYLNRYKKDEAVYI